MSIELNVPQTNHREAEKDRDAATGTRDGLFVHALIVFVFVPGFLCLRRSFCTFGLAPETFSEKLGQCSAAGLFFENTLEYPTREQFFLTVCFPLKCPLLNKGGRLFSGISLPSAQA